MKKLMIIVALVALPFLALAQVVPTPEDPSAFATFVLQAIQAKQWAVVGIAATIGLVFLLRKLGTKIPGAVGVFFGTRRGGALLAVLGGLAIAFATPIISGTPLGFDVVTNAIIYGVGAAGGWTVVRRLVLGDAVAVPAQEATPAPTAPAV
jgi:hypothetical protein